LKPFLQNTGLLRKDYFRISFFDVTRKRIISDEVYGKIIGRLRFLNVEAYPENQV